MDFDGETLMIRQPVLFISHGSPMRALEGGAWGEALRALGTTLRPEGILVASAHWEAEGPARITASPQPEVIHDFYGFPQELYSVDYPAPGHPDWARRIASALAAADQPSALEDRRGLDHGAWAPLVHLFPAADRPVLQLSLPMDRTPASLRALGAALAPLRDQGLLVIGSGGMVHNLRRLDWHHPDSAAPAPWAAAYDAWAWDRLQARDGDSLARWRELAPEPLAAHPTSEHWDPLFVALGAAGDAAPRPVFEGWELGSLSLRSLIWD